jgi:crossover junction endodeoxyribonuclease RusA
MATFSAMPSNTTVVIDLPYPRVTGNHAVKHTRSGAHYLTDEAREYHDLVARAVRGLRAPGGRIRTDWLLAPPDRRARDHTTLLKLVEDSLTRASFWADDSNKIIGAGSWDWATSPVKEGCICLTVGGI